MRDFRVAVAQMDVKLGEKGFNLEKASGMVSEASQKGADFVCFPEYFLTGSFFEKCDIMADSIPGPSIGKLSALAKEYGVHIIASLLEKDGSMFYNTAVLLGSDGELMGQYNKQHLFLDEQNHITAGRESVVVDTKYGKVGLMICYDAVFPEVARQLALDGAEIIFIPANWPNPFLHQWRISTRARALDNQTWVVAANRVGADKKFTYFGRSNITDPYGQTILECGEKEGITTADIDKKTGEEFKKTVNFLKDLKKHK
jgi:omega-amidase